MNKGMKLTLAKQEDFLGIKCDFYKDESNNIYMTRRQIGEALAYANPDDAMYKIHKRNKERLDKFSIVAKLSSTDNKEYDTMIYNSSGIYEITFMSRKPIAENFRDWVMKQVEMIRRTGMAMPNVELALEEVFHGLDSDVQAMVVKNYQNKLEEANQALEEAKPKVESWEAYMDSKGNIDIGNVAKALNVKGIGRNNMFKLLRKKGVLMDTNEPYQSFIDRGYFTTIVGQRNGYKFIKPLATSKGAEWIGKKVVEWGY